MSVLKELVFTPKCLICSRFGFDFCTSCIEKVKPFRSRNLVELDACYCADEYCGWIRDSIIGYKNGDRRYCNLFSILLNRTIEKFLNHKNLTLIPIPSSDAKISERGFDSISILCEAISKQNKYATFDGSNLFLKRVVADQVGLSASERQANLQGAFSARRSLSGLVVVVDDVVTTGATLNNAARALRFAGAQQVVAVTLCGSPKTR